MPTGIESERGDRGAKRHLIRYSQRLANFDADLKAFDAHLTANATRLAVGADKVTEVTTYRTTVWDVKYATYLAPATHTREAVIGAEMAYNEGMAIIRPLRQQIKNNSEITLEESDYVELGIHMNKGHRTPTPIPEYPPNLQEIETKHNTNRFHASFPDSAGTGRLAIPYRNRIQIECAYLPPGNDPAEPTEEDFHLVSQKGRANFTLHAPTGVEAGSRGFVRARYVNAKGEMGPVSATLAFTVI